MEKAVHDDSGVVMMESHRVPGGPASNIRRVAKAASQKVKLSMFLRA